MYNIGPRTISQFNSSDLPKSHRTAFPMMQSCLHLFLEAQVLLLLGEGPLLLLQPLSLIPLSLLLGHQARLLLSSLSLLSLPSGKLFTQGPVEEQSMLSMDHIISLIQKSIYTSKHFHTM